MQRIGKVKIVLCGDEAVGKTTLRKSFMGDKQTVTYMATIGADFAKRDSKVTKDGVEYIIESLIWDLAGQEAYKIVRESFYEGSNGALLIVDITRPETFDTANKWLDELWKNNGKEEKIPFVILGNKNDLRESNKESLDENEAFEKFSKIKNYAIENGTSFNIRYLETSAINGINVDKAFEYLLSAILDENLAKK